MLLFEEFVNKPLSILMRWLLFTIQIRYLPKRKFPKPMKLRQ